MGKMLRRNLGMILLWAKKVSLQRSNLEMMMKEMKMLIMIKISQMDKEKKMQTKIINRIRISI